MTEAQRYLLMEAAEDLVNGMSTGYMSSLERTMFHKLTEIVEEIRGKSSELHKI